MNKKVKIGITMLIMVVGCILSGCHRGNNDQSKVTIAYQYGIGYAPVIIMKEKQLLEEKLPGVEIEWKVMNSGAAINEGIASGDIDVAMMGVAPFLIGWDKGIPYKIYSAMSCQPMGLMVNDDSIRNLSDFTAKDKIAIVSYGSIQHIILSMAAEKKLGDIHAIDDLILTMAHPEAYTALITGSDVKAHMATMPYYSMELEEGMQEVVSTDEAFMRNSTLLVGLASNEFKEKSPKSFEALVEATQEARQFIEDEEQETAEILAKEEGISPESMLAYLNTEGMAFPEETVGILKLAEFMKRADFINTVPENIRSVTFDNLISSN